MRKIALLGYGKMGRAMDALASEEGCMVVGRYETTPSSLEGAEVAIDFSHGRAVANHAKLAADEGCQLVIGTTGWEEDLDQVRGEVERGGIGAIYAPNFSLGVHLFLRLVERSADLFGYFPQYDTACLELHHRAKVDAPSGTALTIAEKMKGAPICSLRCGSIPGTHTVLYDSLDDTIEITHRARGRTGFARGALQAAHWISQRRGWYTIDDLIEERVGCI